MHKISAITAIVMAGFFSTSVLAGPVASEASEAPAIHENGAYIEGNVGAQYATVSIWGNTYGAFGSVGANFNAGYQWNRYFGTEAGYTLYGIGNGTINGVDLALKGIIPFTVGNSNMSVFGKFGGSYLFSDGDSEILPLVGAGVSYGLTSNLDLNVQAQTLLGGFYSFGLASVGLTYHFD